MKRFTILLFTFLVLFTVLGCAKQYPPAWTYNYKFNVVQDGNEYFMNFQGQKHTLLKISDDFVYAGTTDEVSLFKCANAVIVVMNRFGTFKEKLTLEKPTEDNKSAHLVSVTPHGVNGEYWVLVKSKDYGEYIEVAYVHHDITAGGWSNMFVTYAELLDPLHAFSKWPNDLPDKEHFVDQVVARARDAVLILPKK